MSEYHLDESAAALGVLQNVWFHKPEPLFLDQLSAGVIEHWPTQITHEVEACGLINSSLQDDGVEAIKHDYIRLLVGPTKKLAYPWGSVYTDAEGAMFGETTQAFKDFCQANQVELALPYRQPQDHIAIQLAVLSKMLENGNYSAAKVLLSEHLLPWVERFITSVEQHANTGYYRGFAQLMRVQLRRLASYFDVQPKPLKLFR